MTDKITHISKVIIKKLWGYSDLNFEWKLNPDVNVLAGDNGSGKSTILKLIATILVESLRQTNINIIKELAGKIEVYSNNKHALYVNFKTKELEQKAKQDKAIKKFITELKKQHKWEDYTNNYAETGYFLIPIEFEKELNISIINTFDQELKEKESIQKLSNRQVKTELDWDIYQLQELYKDYQINIGKRANEILKRAIKDGTDGLAKAEQEVDKKKNIFLDMIDDLFKITQKRIDRDKNEISFIQREKDISPYQLSSGEKQILVILLAALIQDNKHSVMIMDEPEISLHTDWQENLIDNIRKLNENAQIIIATHSPFIISKGWASEKYVFQMDKIKLR